MINKPENLNTSDYFAGYVNLAEGNDLLSALEDSRVETHRLFVNLTEENGDFCYAEGKWSVKQVLQHLIDTERVFCYRALCYARRDRTELPAFDEDSFAANDFVSERSLGSVLDEYNVLRKSTITLFASFSSQVLDNLGVANGNNFTPRILGWVLVGHDDHHRRVMQGRYLPML